MFCVQSHEMWINDGNLWRSWVCAFGACKENIELNGAHCKGVRNVSSRRVGATTPPTTSWLHAAIEPSQLDILTVPPPPHPSSYRRHVNKWGKLIAQSVEWLKKPRVYHEPWKGCPANGTRYIRGTKWDNDQSKHRSWFFWVVLP